MSLCATISVTTGQAFIATASPNVPSKIVDALTHIVLYRIYRVLSIINAI